MLWSILLVTTNCPAQPPLPPEERPRTIGTVIRLTEADGIVLQSGLGAPLADGLTLNGAERLEDIEAGDLVEIVQDENGLVTRITVIPRLTRRRPLVEVTSGNTPISRFWWTDGDQDFPDSIYAADVSVPFQVPALALEATVAYRPQGVADAVEFAVLDHEGAVLWSRRIAAGQSAQLRCTLAKGGSVTLRCRRADGSTPDHTHCVWGSPSVLLREMGMLAVTPATADELVAKLADSLGNIDPGAIGIAQPKVIGVSTEMVRDLREDLLSAMARRYQVIGLMPWEAGADLTEAQREAARSVNIASIATSEIRYSPEGSVASVTLVDVEGREVLARAESTIEP